MKAKKVLAPKMDMHSYKMALNTAFLENWGQVPQQKAAFYSEFNTLLILFYGTYNYPDNFETRYRFNIEEVGSGNYLWTFEIHSGDFTVSHLCYISQNKAQLNYDDTVELCKIFSVLGLRSNPIPVKVDNLLYKLYPDLRRKNKINSLLQGLD